MTKERLPLLLIADNPGEARVIEMLLSEVPVETAGFQLTRVDRLSKGLEHLRQTDFALVLVDLPCQDNQGLARLQRLLREAPHVPVIGLGDRADLAYAREVVRQGAQDYLVKRKCEAAQFIGACWLAIERGHIKNDLHQSETRYALAIQGANDGLWDWDLLTNEIYFAPRWKTILGYKDAGLESRLAAWFGRIHPEDLKRVEREIKRHLENISPQLESEHRIRDENNTFRWVLVRGQAVRDRTGRAIRMAGTLTDIAGRKKYEEQLLKGAFHDALTGLPNRALFYDRLDQLLIRTKRNVDLRFALLYLDLDRFKMINDRYGHNFGDEVLIEVAERIKKGLRASDTVARLSGDEFAVLLLDSAASSEAARVAKRIQDTLRSPILWQGHEVFVSASIGIALSDLSYQLVEEIVRDADIAMYQAKSRGKAQHVVFDKPMRARVLARLDMEAELRQAIGQGEFQVYYQPIMSLDEERLVGFEAFVRWQHPTRGLLNAADFIPIAEETGLIIPIDWWVLRAACQQLVTWQRQFPFTPPLTVSVNLSKRHFAEQDLVDQLKNILQATGLDSTCLRLEITERVMTENPITATSLLVQVQALGVQLLIDNFGIGPTSINWLQQFPVNAVKIDPSFIRELDNAGNPVDFVHNLVAQARDMGLEVIAERIENLDQLAQLQDLACKFGQGYLFAKPMDHQTATAFVS